MAFTVEDGTGLAGANAYISVATADAYHLDRGNVDWADAGPSEQEQAIVRATDYMDQTWNWQGKKKTETQALAWPRDAAFDLDANEIDPDSVPAQVERACAELALAALCRDLDPDSSEDSASQETKSAGGMSISRTLAKQQPAFHKAKKMLHGLLAARRLMRS